MHENQVTDITDEARGGYSRHRTPAIGFAAVRR